MGEWIKNRNAINVFFSLKDLLDIIACFFVFLDALKKPFIDRREFSSARSVT